MALIRFAIIGCGRIAQRHAEQICKRGKLVAVCDVIHEKASSMAEMYGARAYYNITDLLFKESNLDIIVVCTPNGLHAQHSIQSLQAGFHVLCEKPMALHAKDAAEMIAVARKSGRQLFVVKQNRYNPPVVAVKKALDENRLGKVFSLQLNCFWNRDASYYKNSWKGTRELDGGTLYTQFSHFIDLLYWMIGDIKEVHAVLANYAHQQIIEFEDTGSVLLQFENGATGTMNYTVNSYSKNMEGSLTLFAEKGTVKIGGQYLNELEYQDIKDYRIDNLPAGNIANNYGTYVGSMSNHDKVYDNVLDVLHDRAPITTPAEEGLKTVEIIERIYQTATRL
ncbi:Gfo/Idh/MocA family protein [Longitalea arenae]|uniref:Gfo/Idh/MocA family protein n=1 Tax=Longitalea arenae TaxID=2812558 RepID=UPI0019679EB3|nr:Gfo/Idh/MocA family oxidoreductase [Longitalea arenae]